MKRAVVFAAAFATVLLGLYSCSMHAALTTDSAGRVVRISAVRVESSLHRLVVAMLVVGGQVGFEFRWTPGAAGFGLGNVEKLLP